MKRICVWAALSLSVLCAGGVWGETWESFGYRQDRGGLTIETYTGDLVWDEVPSHIHGLPVVAIGDGAFSGNTKLQRIVIPRGIKRIGVGAFNGATNLQDVVLSDGVEEIGAGAFEGCTALRRIEIPDSVRAIEDEAFKDCSALGDVLIGVGLKTIQHRVFAECISLTNLYFMGDMPARGTDILRSTPLTRVYRAVSGSGWSGTFDGKSLAVGVVREEWIDRNSGFGGSNILGLQPGAPTGTYYLTHLIAGPSNSHYIVTNIRSAAFAYQDAITSVSLLSGAAKLGTNLFYNSPSLRSVRWNAGQKVVPARTFYGCSNLVDVILPEGVTTLRDSAFEKCVSLKSITLPSTITNIESAVFLGCTNLVSIVIPAGLVSIYGQVFRENPRLKSVYFLGNVPDTNFSNNLFWNSPNVTVYYTAGATGWGTNFFDRPVKLWDPHVVGVAKAGGGAGAMNVTVAADENVPFAIEATDDLKRGAWYRFAVVTNWTDATAMRQDLWATNGPVSAYRLTGY